MGWSELGRLLPRLPWVRRRHEEERIVPLEERWMLDVDDDGNLIIPPTLAREVAEAVPTKEGERRLDMSGSGANRPGSGDPSDGGHPCEAALEFRRVLRLWGYAMDLPADILDLCISIAWIGKAISRTEAMQDFREMGIDPHTWKMIPGMVARDEIAALALNASMHAPPELGRESDLAMVRQSEAFRIAHDAISRAVSPAHRTSAAAWRWARLREMSHGVIEVRPPRLPPQVVDLEIIRRRRAAKAQAHSGRQ